MAIRGRRAPLKTVIIEKGGARPVIGTGLVLSFAAQHASKRFHAPLLFKPTILVGNVASRKADKPVVLLQSIETAKKARTDRIFRPTIKSKTAFTMPTAKSGPPYVVSFAATRFDPARRQFRTGYRVISRNQGVPVPFPVPSPFIKAAGLIARDPRSADQDGLSPRMRRLTETVASVLNSLYGTGQLVQKASESWAITQKIWQGARAPTSGDDSSVGIQAGTIWVDTATGVIYICTSATPGMAVWQVVPTISGLSGTFP